MAGIPQNFQSISPVLSNYNFVDIASGTGYINFYAGSTVDTKLLSNNAFYSDVVAETTGYTGTGAAYTLLFDYDFDILLNRPLDLKGFGIVAIPLGANVGAAGHNTDCYVHVILRKWDGVTETDLFTNDSRVWVGDQTTNLAYTMLAVDLPITLTHFKKGETLRLTLMYYARETNHGMRISIAYDPENRTAGWDTTGACPSRLVFYCPVRLNL
jgi:hypothetical protein